MVAQCTPTALIGVALAVVGAEAQRLQAKVRNSTALKTPVFAPAMVSSQRCMETSSLEA